MAKSVRSVKDVFFLEELGTAEAIWVFEVEEFGPLLVTMDSKGSSIHKNISEEIKKNLEEIKSEL